MSKVERIILGGIRRRCKYIIKVDGGDLCYPNSYNVCFMVSGAALDFACGKADISGENQKLALLNNVLIWFTAFFPPKVD